MSLDENHLKNVQQAAGKKTAACPACQENGEDKDQNHLCLYPDGKYGCITHINDSEHRARIFAIAGKRHKKTPNWKQHRSLVKGAALLQDQRSNTATLFSGCSLDQYSKAKRIRLDFLCSLGLTEITYMGVQVLRIPYRDVNGVEKAIRFRVELYKTPERDYRFQWKKGSKTFLYGCDRIQAAINAGYLVIAEGESDCHTLWFHGIPALGIPGAGTWQDARDIPIIKDVQIIYVVLEPDQGGEVMREAFSKSRIRERIRFVKLDGFKDVSDMHIADPERFPERLKIALSKAVSWSDAESARRENERRTSFEVCKQIAMAPDILSLFEQDLKAIGVIGESRVAKILFLALCSRVFNRPVSVAVKGPSAGGKSFTVESVLRFLPDSAFYALTAMSDRALAYSEEPLKHRFLVIYELSGMESEITSYLIRSLLSEGRLRYAFVDKSDGILSTRIIEKEGPTGLLVTTTATRLHPENETRLLSLTITDTQEQTTLILNRIAKELS